MAFTPETDTWQKHWQFTFRTIPTFDNQLRTTKDTTLEHPQKLPIIDFLEYFLSGQRAALVHAASVNKRAIHTWRM